MSTNPSIRSATISFWWIERTILSVPETTLVLFASFLSLYLLFLPDIAYQPWDSLDYAYSTETLGIITMRGNHPLGHVIHYLAFAFAKLLGYGGRALFTAQIVNAVAGAIAVALFFNILANQLKIRQLIAAGFAIAFGASYAFWLYTGTADIYIISLLCILLTWSSLIHEVTWSNRALPVASGISAGVAIIAHQLNILLIPTGMFLVLLTSGRFTTLERKTKQLTAFLLLAALTFISGYILLGFIATSSHSLEHVIGWARGHFGDPTYGRYFSSEFFHTALDTASQAITSNAMLARFIPLSFFLMALGLILRRSLDESKRVVLIISTLQAFGTAVLILWWEPQNIKFWILALVPWMLSLALSVEAIDSQLRDKRLRLHPSLTILPSAFAALTGILVLVSNFSVISTQHNPQSETAIAFRRAMDLWTQHSDSDSLLITAGDLVPHLLYWGDRPGTVILYRSLQASQSTPNAFDELHAQIERTLCEHRTLLLTPEAAETITDNELALVDVSRGELRSFLEGYTWQGRITFWYNDLIDGKRVPVYELINTADCVN